jgi:DNA invertase Pin-like site-specific DNA recombinase
MKTAILYIRVSTDEQADKGYSQRAQDETLHRYCELNGIRPVKVVYEDHSAKTFERPAWRAMLAGLKKIKADQQPDLLLFTKWDRFSRNAGDAYQMIAMLNRLGCEPQAIEQPLDLAIPENKMMMAFYLAAPEVENDRRALNVKHGMRRAKKEGRYMGIAPVGYANKSYENGQKYIAPKEPLAELMRWAFNEVATGRYPVEQVWRKARGKGLTCCPNNFRNALRNPVYCGKVIVPATKDEPEYWTEGQHQPLIPERLFLKVQGVLKSRAAPRTKLRAPEQLPLRGLLKCPKCHRMLTGSASKGRNGYFYYYHCQPGCPVRFKAPLINEQFFASLSTYILKPFILPVLKTIIREVFAAQNTEAQHLYQLALKQADLLNARLERARELLLQGDLDGDEYRSIRQTAQQKLSELQETLADCGTEEKISRLLFSKERELARLSNYLTDKGSETLRRLVSQLAGSLLKIKADGCIDIQPLVPILKLFMAPTPLSDRKKGETGRLNNSRTTLHRG